MNNGTKNGSVLTAGAKSAMIQQAWEEAKRRVEQSGNEAEGERAVEWLFKYMSEIPDHDYKPDDSRLAEIRQDFHVSAAIDGPELAFEQMWQDIETALQE